MNKDLKVGDRVILKYKPNANGDYEGALFGHYHEEYMAWRLLANGKKSSHDGHMFKGGQELEILKVNKDTYRVGDTLYNLTNQTWTRDFYYVAEVKKDSVVPAFELQYSEKHKELFDTSNMKIRYLIDEEYTINDIFGENPNDYEILRFKQLFQGQKEVTIQNKRIEKTEDIKTKIMYQRPAFDLDDVLENGIDNVPCEPLFS